MTRHTFTRWIALAAVALFAGSAAAHSLDPGASSFSGGLAHPFLGLDHLLAMVAVGLWAAQLGGRAKWAIPAAFVAASAGGAVLAWAGGTLPHADAAITLSVLVLGLFVALRQKSTLPAATAIAGAFALFHGFAHGLEMPPTAWPGWDAAGFVIGTALLHAAGVVGGMLARRSAPYVGAAIAASGILLLLGG